MGTNRTIPGRWSVEPRTSFDIVILLQKWHQPIMTLQEIGIFKRIFTSTILNSLPLYKVHN